MKLLILSMLLALTQAAVLIVKPNKNDCTSMQIDYDYYDKEVLKSDIDRPYLLAVDRSENILYFSYSVNSDDMQFRSAYIDLKTKEFNDIKDIDEGFAQTVDEKTGDVYIGGAEGIFKFNHKTKESSLFGEKGNDIWYLYFKDRLYFSVFPTQRVFTYEAEKVETFKDLEDTRVDYMVIDKDNDIVFSNATGVFTQKFGTKDAVHYPKSQWVRGITTDKNGTPYIVKYNGIFIVDKKNQSLKKILDLEDPFGVAFDANGNMIYAAPHELIRLVPNEITNNC